MELKNKVFLSIGSNLGDRIQFLKIGLTELKKIGEIRLVSPIYETEPLGFNSNSNFLNLCIAFQTNLSPDPLLETIHSIEALAGRIRTSNTEYASRTLDIDIVFYNDLVFNTKKLTIPHPNFRLRRFVLEPLCAIAASLIDPVSFCTVEELLQQCPDQSSVVLKNIDVRY